jgi:UDP-2-acetamido-3-amino-2,3-dideoxy-glucuronate N-acetyltransferase
MTASQLRGDIGGPIPAIPTTDASSHPFVHPQALCESKNVGSGTRIWAFAHVMSGAVVGSGCNVGDGAFLEAGAIVGNRVTIKNQVMIWDGVVIGDDCFLGPGVIFTNDRTPRSPRMPQAAKRYGRPENWRSSTIVESGASIGAGAIIVCGVKIGQYAMVGAGAVVTRDVPAHQLVAGNPARALGWVCQCGARLSPSLTCSECDRRVDVGVGHESSAGAMLPKVA